MLTNRHPGYYDLAQNHKSKIHALKWNHPKWTIVNKVHKLIIII